MRMRYQSYLMIMCSFNLRRGNELSGTEDSVRFTCLLSENFMVWLPVKPFRVIFRLSLIIICCIKKKILIIVFVFMLLNLIGLSA